MKRRSTSATRVGAADAAVRVRQRLQAALAYRLSAVAADAVSAELDLRERAVDLRKLGGGRLADAREHRVVLHLHDLLGEVLVERAGRARDVGAHLRCARQQLLLLLLQLAPDRFELARHRTPRPTRAAAACRRPGSRQFTCTSTVLGFGAGTFGTRTFSTPFLLSARMAPTSASSGSRKLRAKRP